MLIEIVSIISKNVLLLKLVSVTAQNSTLSLIPII